MKPEAIQINMGLPEEICEHRQWVEIVNVKFSHDPEHCEDSFYTSPGFITSVINLANERAKNLDGEIRSSWDYLRISPEVSVVERTSGYGWDIEKLSPDGQCVEDDRWQSIRIYARAYRIRPMNNEKAKIARGLIADILDDKITSDEAIATFNGH